MSTDNAASAKDLVLAWVRERNPQTMELEFGCKVRIKERSEPAKVSQEDVSIIFVPDFQPSEFGLTICSVLSAEGIEGCAIREWSHQILGSDMGLQELLIAFKQIPIGMSLDAGKLYIHGMGRDKFVFDLTKNLHQQSDEFYSSILSIIRRTPFTLPACPVW